MANAQMMMTKTWKVKMLEMPVARQRIMDRIPSLVNVSKPVSRMPPSEYEACACSRGRESCILGSWRERASIWSLPLSVDTYHKLSMA